MAWMEPSRISRSRCRTVTGEMVALHPPSERLTLGREHAQNSGDPLVHGSYFLANRFPDLQDLARCLDPKVSQRGISSPRRQQANLLVPHSGGEHLDSCPRRKRPLQIGFLSLDRSLTLVPFSLL